MKLKNFRILLSLIFLTSVFIYCESPTKPERDDPRDAKGTNYQVPAIPQVVDPGDTTAYGTTYFVAWEKAERAKGYTIQESPDSSFTAGTVSVDTDSTSTSFNHLVKTPTSYYYRVKGTNGDYESGWSTIVDMTVNPAAPIKPDNLQVTALSSTQITLSWTDNSDNEVGFSIERRELSTQYSVIGTVASGVANYTDASLLPSTVYYYRVRAFNAGGMSEYSPEAAGTTKAVYTLSITANQSGWGTTNPSAGSYSYEEGTIVTVTAAPASGYQFTGWTGNVVDPSSVTTTVNMRADLTIIANFEKIPPKQYTLTMGVNQSSWGTTSPAVGAHIYEEGSVVTVTAQPVSGYMFVNWTGNVANSSSSTTTVTISGDRTVTATFKRITYTLTIKVNTTGWGTTIPSVGSHSYDEGTTVTVIATPASGYQFVNWTGNVADTNNSTTTVPINADKTVTANFEKIPVQSTDIIMVSIPGGRIQMDYNYMVTLSGFDMSIYEITQGQYRSIMSASPSFFTGDDNLPVEQVSWLDAIKFCNALSANAGLDKCYNESTGACDFTKNGFRLPTEAEWEYACRAGTTTNYYTGDSESDLARAGWYDGNSSNMTHTVGQKTPNAWGLYDMHGNVWEWCNDWYVSYGSGNVTNPTGPQSGSYRVDRGGGWDFYGGDCRSASRDYDYPDVAYYNFGFRVVRRP